MLSMSRPLSLPATPPQSLIIHHLSDLHRGRNAGGRHALDLYVQRQRRLPPERQPDVLIVTGDLTVSGSRDELHEAAFALRNLTLQWDEPALRQHVFVVPGPHDIDWSAASTISSFDAFSQEFRSFCIPLFPARDGTLLPGPEPYAQSFADHFIVYTLNTCYAPETLPKPLPKGLDDLVKRYRDLWKDYQRSTSRAGGAFDPGLRQQFLTATETLIQSDGGVILPADVDRFFSAVQTMHLDELPLATSFPGDDQSNPLRIIVTHHPLIAHVGRTGRSYGKAANSEALLRHLRRFGFHLALHGHTHESHFLADLPIEPYGTNNDMPLLQIGSGSLGGGAHDANTFNEIVATRSPSAGKWGIEMLTINLDSEHDRPPMRITLHNPLAGLSNLRPTRVEEDSAAMHREFERRLRIITRQFVEAIEEDAAEIPARALDTIKDAIKENIFSGIETRVSLALKQRTQLNGPIVLANRYIIPDTQVDDQYLHPYSYPETVAAWSLILGEVLVYPRMFREQDALINFDWLQHTGKYEMIIKQLQELAVHGKFPQRAATLLSKLQTRGLRNSDLFQDWLPAPVQTRFKSFAAVPIPLKSTLTRPRELGVLLVDVVDPEPEKPAAVFTDDRLDMLRTLAYTIDTILTTADKMRQPRGLWHTV